MPVEIPADLRATLDALKANRFDARFAATGAAAREMMLDLTPAGAVVGLGDSTTIRQIGIVDALERRGNELLNPWTRRFTQDMAGTLNIRGTLRDLAKRALTADVFLCSVNALTRGGELVSIDRGGNRVAGMIFGPGKVILPVGRNKIVKDVAEGISRIKSVIAPAHTKRKEMKTPCAATGVCANCNSPERICNITVILEKRPPSTDMTVILIDEDLGLGWDPSWESQRIQQIRSSYEKNTWVFLYAKVPPVPSPGGRV